MKTYLERHQINMRKKQRKKFDAIKRKLKKVTVAIKQST